MAGARGWGAVSGKRGVWVRGGGGWEEGVGGVGRQYQVCKMTILECKGTALCLHLTVPDTTL